MSEALAARAEILKLARVLGREATGLEYLKQVPSADIRALREQVTEVLFAAHGQALGRLAAASKLLPVGLVATIGERAFGPVLSARMTCMLEPSRAVEMAAKLPVAFLADVAVDLDPRRASDVISQIPAPQIAEITRELIRREEHVTMGRFVGHLSPEAIRAAVGEMDNGSLLRVAFVLESKDSLEELVGLLAPERLDGIIDVAASANLWPEVLDLLSHLSEQRRRRFATMPSIQAEGVLEAIVRVAAEQSLWLELLPLARLLPAEARVRIARFAETLELDEAAIEAIAALDSSAGQLPG